MRRPPLYVSVLREAVVITLLASAVLAGLVLFRLGTLAYTALSPF